MYKLYKNGETDRAAVWARQTVIGPDNLVLDVTAQVHSESS